MKEVFHSSVGQIDPSFEGTTEHDEAFVHGAGADVFGDDKNHQVSLVRAEAERYPLANLILEPDSIPDFDMATCCRLDDHRDRHLWNTLLTIRFGRRRHRSRSDPDSIPRGIRIVHQSGAHPVQAQPSRWYVEQERLADRTWLIEYQSTIWVMPE